MKKNQFGDITDYTNFSPLCYQCLLHIPGSIAHTGKFVLPEVRGGVTDTVSMQEVSGIILSQY